jgi:hypothetical protein
MPGFDAITLTLQYCVLAIPLPRSLLMLVGLASELNRNRRARFSDQLADRFLPPQLVSVTFPLPSHDLHLTG